MTRPPTAAGLCRVWWPAPASGLLDLLALAVVVTPAGRRFIAGFPLPRMTTRRWMIAVAALGIEGGLVISTMRYTGVDPLHAEWARILLSLAGLHALAFAPAGVVLLHCFLRDRRSREDPEAVMVRP